jgi:hypothetical protein
MPAGIIELIRKLNLHIKEKPSKQQNKPSIAQIRIAIIEEDKTIKIHLTTQKSLIKKITRFGLGRNTRYQQIKNSCYKKGLNKNHNLMKTSGWLRSQQYQMVNRSLVKLIKTKYILLHIRNHSVPRCKNYPPWLHKPIS